MKIWNSFLGLLENICASHITYVQYSRAVRDEGTYSGVFNLRSYILPHRRYIPRRLIIKNQSIMQGMPITIKQLFPGYTIAIEFRIIVLSFHNENMMWATEQFYITFWDDNILNISHTESRRIFELLKFPCITFASSLWRNARPLAAPITILIRCIHESGWR